MRSPQQWAEDDLTRVGEKLAEFAHDAFHDPRQKRDLLEEVSSAVRRVEDRYGVTIT